QAEPGKSRLRHQFIVSGDGNVCAETRAGGEVVVWDFARKAQRATIRRAGLPSASAAEADTGGQFTIPLEVAPMGRLGPSPQRSGDREPQALNRDGSRFAGLDAGYLKVWDTSNGKELGRLRYRPCRFDFAAGTADRLHLLDAAGVVWSWSVGAERATRACVL